MVRLWHSPQKLCFYNSSNNNSINNSIDRTKKFWQNSEYKKVPSSFAVLMPSSDSITSSIPINQLPNMSTSASAQLKTVPHTVQINANQCQLNFNSILNTYLPLTCFRIPILVTIFARRLSILPANPIARDLVC